jgi:hypothetical protein
MRREALLMRLAPADLSERGSIKLNPKAEEPQKFLDSVPIGWLLGGEPFVQYRTLIDILDRTRDDPEVLAVERVIHRHKLVREIFRRQNKDGYWGTPKDIYAWWPKKETTFWMLGVLADFGLRKDTKQVARACEYVFSTQLPCGGFGWAPPPTPGDCFTGILTESLAKLGCSDDARLGDAYKWLVGRQRLDGGFWCKDTGQPGRPREQEPSCAFGTLCVLGALAQNPELRDGTIAKRGAEFLLTCWEKRGKIKYAGHDSQIGRGWDKLKYPFTDYRILKYLDVLSQFDFAQHDPRIGAMIDLLISKRDRNGRYYAESIHQVWSDFDFGQKKRPSRWITLLACRIVKAMQK